MTVFPSFKCLKVIFNIIFAVIWNASFGLSTSATNTMIMSIMMMDVVLINQRKQEGKIKVNKVK